MEAITVAMIASIGTIIAALVQKGRVENKKDHGRVVGLLSSVKDDIIDLHRKIDHVDYHVDRVDDKIDAHIQSHRRNKKY